MIDVIGEQDKAIERPRTGPNHELRQFLVIKQLMAMMRKNLKALDPCKATIVTNDSTKNLQVVGEVDSEASA
jgi:hypothetical protein